MFGVFMYGCPDAPVSSKRRSSTRMTIRLGFIVLPSGGAARGQLILMLSSFTSRPYFSKSSRYSLANCSGEPPTPSSAACAKRSRIAGRASALSTSTFKRLTASARRAGRHEQPQPLVEHQALQPRPPRRWARRAATARASRSSARGCSACPPCSAGSPARTPASRSGPGRRPGRRLPGRRPCTGCA